MKLPAALTAVLAALLAASAHATTFNFSYSFDPANTGNGEPVVITGSFDGTAVGDLISDISNASLWINGTAFTGPLTISGIDTATGSPSGSAVVSLDATQANFAFADDGLNNFFTIAGGQAFAVDYNLTDSLGNAISGAEAASNASWAVAAVPEPASYALLAAGLFVIGAATQRRRPQA